jgi:hypothetical protein
MNDKIDAEELLAEMGQIAKDAGNWRDHMPYEAACTFTANADIHRIYARHVSDCEYCQELVALFGSGSGKPEKD